jgi:hypothetical protein
MVQCFGYTLTFQIEYAIIMQITSVIESIQKLPWRAMTRNRVTALLAVCGVALVLYRAYHHFWNSILWLVLIAILAFVLVAVSRRWQGRPLRWLGMHSPTWHDRLHGVAFVSILLTVILLLLGRHGIHEIGRAAYSGIVLVGMAVVLLAVGREIAVSLLPGALRPKKKKDS